MVLQWKEAVLELPFCIHLRLMEDQQGAHIQTGESSLRHRIIISKVLHLPILIFVCFSKGTTLIANLCLLTFRTTVCEVVDERNRHIWISFRHWFRDHRNQMSLWQVHSFWDHYLDVVRSNPLIGHLLDWYDMWDILKTPFFPLQARDRSTCRPNVLFTGLSKNIIFVALA